VELNVPDVGKFWIINALDVKWLLQRVFKMNFFQEKTKNKFLFLKQKKTLICLLIIIVSFFLDRITKIKIINHQINNSRLYINDYTNFDLVWNTGVGFGIFSSNSNLIYNSISAVIGLVIIFLIYIIVKSKFIDKIFFTLLLGGALGNFYDRLVYSAVPDFIDIHYKDFHWFTFNIADIFITISVITLITKDLFSKNEKN
jgi:signal peptidase II